MSVNVCQSRLALVGAIVGNIVRRLPPNVDREDLRQSGVEGLLDACTKYREGTGASFETYAGKRIRGAVLDALRRDTWAPREVTQARRSIEKAASAAAQRFGRQPRHREVAEQLGISLSEYHRMRSLADREVVQTVDDAGAWGVADPASALDAQLDQERMERRMADAIKELAGRKRMVIENYYFGDLRMSDLAALLGVTPSRVTQIRNEAESAIRRACLQ